VGIAGQEKDTDVRPQHTRGFRKLAAVHAGKPDIGRQQVYLRIGFQDADSALGFLRLDHPVAFLRQRLHHQHPDKRLVLDHQDGFTLAGGRRVRQCRHGLGRRRRSLVTGQVELHRRTAPLF
jgi:hypothetical protein